MKYSKPSKIQERALPLLLANPPTNFMGQSQSGTGKTAAFSLAMLSRCDENSNTVQAIVLSPARELARQTLDVINEMGKYTNMKTSLIVPGAFERGAHIKSQIVVGTPGSVGDLIRRRQISVDSLKVFVLDEADNMLDAQGLGDQCVRIKKAITSKNNSCQMVLFSATFDTKVKAYANAFVVNPIRLKY
ncbi:unnamed protein product [[Candida] boidinii]|uniref:Unnamed protein product n=1 Tax=Candida boidinii TaxID=5477 RepID=A0ACB5U7X3_CANBO|nr:unnamed protein product [[Candida] boidinii]